MLRFKKPFKLLLIQTGENLKARKLLIKQIKPSESAPRTVSVSVGRLSQ